MKYLIHYKGRKVFYKPSKKTTGIIISDAVDVPAELSKFTESKFSKNIAAYMIFEKHCSKVKIIDIFGNIRKYRKRDFE